MLSRSRRPSTHKLDKESVPAIRNRFVALEAILFTLSCDIDSFSFVVSCDVLQETIIITNRFKAIAVIIFREVTCLMRWWPVPATFTPSSHCLTTPLNTLSPLPVSRTPSRLVPLQSIAWPLRSSLASPVRVNAGPSPGAHTYVLLQLVVASVQKSPALKSPPRRQRSAEPQ